VRHLEHGQPLLSLFEAVGAYSGDTIVVHFWSTVLLLRVMEGFRCSGQRWKYRAAGGVHARSVWLALWASKPTLSRPQREGRNRLHRASGQGVIVTILTITCRKFLAECGSRSGEGGRVAENLGR
jgi:hypothetical protein